MNSSGSWRDERGSSEERAGVHHVVTMKPVFKNPDEATFADLGQHLILEQPSQAEPGHCCADHHGRVVERQLPFHAHLQLAAVLLQFPCIKAARRRLAQIDALMIGQVLRGARLRMGGKISG